MGFLSFLKSKPEPEKAPAAETAAAPDELDTAPSDGADAADVADVVAADPEAIVVRAGISDERSSLCGYRFSVTPGVGAVPLPEPVLLATLAAADVAGLGRQRMALVPLTLDAAAQGLHLPLMAPQTVFVIERQGIAAPVEEIAAGLAALRAGGAKVALSGVTAADGDAPLLAACDLVVLNLAGQALADFQALVRHLRVRYAGLKLVIDGVESWDEQRMCLSWGCHYFMGQFLTTSDKVDLEAKVDQSRMTSIELLNLLRSDAELSAMIEVAKRDPGMTFQVLQWANSPANGQTVKVTSLNQAFMVLGRKQLYRGLTVSMFRLGGGANRERDESLLEVALTRARFLETCSTLPQARRDELFLVGLLSLFDVLLGVPMDSLIGKMHLSDEIRDVLLNGEGPYGPYLTMVLLLQRDKVERALEIAVSLGIETEGLGAVGQASFQWAQESIHHTNSDA